MGHKTSSESEVNGAKTREDLGPLERHSHSFSAQAETPRPHPAPDAFCPESPTGIPTPGVPTGVCPSPSCPNATHTEALKERVLKRPSKSAREALCLQNRGHHADARVGLGEVLAHCRGLIDLSGFSPSRVAPRGAGELKDVGAGLHPGLGSTLSPGPKPWGVRLGFSLVRNSPATSMGGWD